MFDNYLNILKLIFIWINLDLKLIPKKINFILVLFYSKFFFFYFIFSYFTSIDFSPLTLSTILRCCPPPFTTTVHHHPPPTIAICYQLSPSSAAASCTICHCSSPLVANSHHLLSPVDTTFPCCPLPLSITTDGHLLPPYAAAICPCRHHYLLQIAATIYTIGHQRPPPSITVYHYS